MTSEAALREASENLHRTYFSLGLAIPKTTLVEDAAFRACLGEFDHPICNFAACLRLDPWSARRLLTMAAGKRSFNVYVVPSDSPKHIAELLQRCGFTVSYRLIQMVAEPSGTHIGPHVVMASGLDKRLEIATFMTEQFFARQTTGFRRRVAMATAQGEGLELYELLSYGRTTGAVMLCRGEAVIGLYNLCVAAANRGVGLGKELTAWALSEAHKERKLVTLQCDARLQPWYENLGFRSTGVVEVFTLSAGGRGDIMSVA